MAWSRSTLLGFGGSPKCGIAFGCSNLGLQAGPRMCFLFWGWLVQHTGPDLGGGTPLHTNTKGANRQIGKVGTRFQRQMGVGWGVRICRFQIGLRAPSVRWASDGGTICQSKSIFGGWATKKSGPLIPRMVSVLVLLLL